MNIKYDFSNRNYVVTGSSRGIGFEIARFLMTAGATVGLVASNVKKLEELEKD